MVNDVDLVGVSHMVPSHEQLKPGLPPALDGDRVVRWNTGFEAIRSSSRKAYRAVSKVLT